MTNSLQTSQPYSAGGFSGNATKIEVSLTNHPHNGVNKIYVAESGWKEGLPIVTEDWADGTSGSERKRWTWTDWTQDDINLTFIQNPRVLETRVGDTTNTKKTTVEYYPISPGSPIALYGLVKEVKVFDTDLSTVLKKSVTEYNLDTAYTSRRIIGLPSKIESYGSETTGLNLMSKVTYNYDEGNFDDSTLEQNISSVIRHDNTNYSAGFITGRGNLNSTTRWNVEYPTSSSEAVTSSVKYNITGAVVAQTDPIGRTVKISYADVFNDTPTNRNTYAYPTKLTDPAGNYSEVEYRFDIGANVWAESPAPEGNTVGKVTTRSFDDKGRLEKESLWKNSALHSYTRYDYPGNGTQSLAYSTIVDTDNDGPDADDEVLQENLYDGAGRVRQSRSDYPTTTGTRFVGQKTEYDILGRVSRQSIPTEIDSNWAPAGDDYTRGYLWTYQKYDWKDRVIRKINTDGVDSPTLNDSDVLISYDGCGCAGGQVTTIQGEKIIENNWQENSPQTMGRKTQKIYQDILGRTFKTEDLNWNSSEYAITVSTFNGRDQAVQIRQYAGNTSGSYQDTTFSYDGHSRLKTQHRPEQDADTYTIYSYNPDDSIESVTDARGVSTDYSYNSKGLVEEISHTVPESEEIPATPVVTFSYDAVGNRTQMIDGLGNVVYEYNQLSQLVSETRQFNDNLPDAPIANNKFKLEYTYTLSGQLNSLKDPFGQQIDYNYDKIGRLSSVTGSTFGGITTYAQNPHLPSLGSFAKLGIQ